MARIRSISPEACESRTLAQLDDFEERCWWRLLPHMDDYGRAKDDALLLCSKAFAVMRGVTEEQVESALQHFAELRLVVRFEARGQRWLQVRSWPRHQSPTNPGKARTPEPPGWHIDKDRKEWVPDDAQPPTPPSEPPSEATTNGHAPPEPHIALCESSVSPTGDVPASAHSPGVLDIGSRKLEVGDRKLEVGDRNSSSSGCLSNERPPSVDDDAPLSPKQTSTAALRLIAQRRTDEALAAGQIQDPSLRGVNAYRQGVAKSLHAEMGAAGLAIVLATPNVTPAALAEQLERLATASLAPPGNVTPLRPQPAGWECPICHSHGMPHSPQNCPLADDETSAQ